MTRKLTFASLFGAAALLAACGGGGDSPAPPTAAADAIPDSASASTAGLKRYLADLAATPVEDKEPLALDNFAPQTSEDAEPEPVG
jgi:hypothetical protein